MSTSGQGDHAGSRTTARRLLTRRSVIGGGSLLAVAVAAGVELSVRSSGSSPAAAARSVLTKRERAVLDAATARLVPGPEDDPAEAGHPGAREAKAADYIVMLLGALRHDPPRVYAGGPFSDRGGSKRNNMARFLPLDDTVRAHWRARLADLVAAYREGLGELDALAGGDFAAASPTVQDAALARNPMVGHLPAENSGFTDLLFQHTIEGCYSAPEYGGNTDLAMWQSIKFPCDVQPRGYHADQVTNSDGPDPYTPTGIVADVLGLITSTAPAPPAPATSPAPPAGGATAGGG
jgi:gluconate 2-dehydrogenase gamma chain